MRDRFVLVAVVAVLGFVVPAAAGAAGPPGLECGQVITTDVVLRADLTCAGDGLVVGASGITVDLAGHTITSTDGTGMGIRIATPTTSSPVVCFGDAEISGGTITGFFAGIGTERCQASVESEISRMRLTNNTWGVLLTLGNHFRIHHVGIVGTNGVGSFVGKWTSSGSADISASSIQVTSPDGYSFRSFMAARGSSINTSRLDGGHILHSWSLGLSISSSQFVHTPIYCEAGGLEMSDSVAIGGGIVGDFCGVSLTGDLFLGPGSGAAVWSFGDLYHSVTVTRSAFAGWETAIDVCAPTTVEDSTFWRNGTGVSVNGCRAGGVVRGSRFVDNSGTGLRLRAGIFVVGSNTALRNGGLGIDAQDLSPTQPTTITDEGGNVARRNQEPQCIGVVCTRR